MPLSALALVLMACPPPPRDKADGGGVGETDAPSPPRIDADPGPTVDAPISIYPDASTDPGDGGMCGVSTVCPNPVENGCNPGGGDTCGDGLDNDCDGQIDENCVCIAGSVQSCFNGPPGKDGVGACQRGMQTCTGSGEFTQWGPCEGGIAPGNEVCDGLDNSCNGCVDDDPECCIVDLNCPGPGDLPDGVPFAPYVINGTDFYNMPVTSWSWEVTGGPCDQLLDSTTGNVSYTLSGQNTDTLVFTPTLSGDYTVTLTIVAASGEVLECTFIIHIGGPGLRVELCWDTTGTADIDLHVHNSGTTTPWFTTTPTGSTVNPDDCYYRNCKGTVFGERVDWGPAYPTSPLTECQNGPDGPDWISYGACHNPRLDVDNISTAGIPENINVDNPLDGATYRTMVHYYGGSATTHPLVNIYCGGTLLGTYGQAPDTVSGFNGGGGFGGGPMWRVVDTTTHVDAMGDTTGCTLTPLNPPGMTTGYWVTYDDRSY